MRGIEGKPDEGGSRAGQGHQKPKLNNRKFKLMASWGRREPGGVRPGRSPGRGVGTSRASSDAGGSGEKKWGGAGRDPSYKMGEGIVFSTVFFWRLRPEIGSNCHPVGSSSKTPSDALQTFSMETGQAGGESAAECGSGGRFSAGGRFYQVKSAIEHNGRYAQYIRYQKPDF